jgi:pectinesterase
MLIHGGGWRSGDRSQHVAMARMLASKGFFAVTVEYRLSTEALYPAPLIDLKTAIRWIRTHASPYYPINNDKFAVWGFSAGGQLAALIGSTNGSTLFGGDKNSDVQAVVDVDGTLAFIHPESGEGNDSKGPSAATLWFGAPASAGTQKWEEAAALNHVSETNPPILFINSSVARMHAGRTDMIRKLDSLHVYSEVHELPDTQHTFPLFDPWFTSTLDYTVAFLNKIFGRS